MWKSHWYHRLGLVLIFLTPVLMAGCATGKVTTGGFVRVSLIDTELRRGWSTKKDVEGVLGAPKGFGGAVLPTDPNPCEVWFYEDIELTDFKSEGEGVLRVNLRQQVLLVFFKKGIFDGFMWFSNAGKVKGEY